MNSFMKNYKPWPDDDKPASFSSITDPICEAIKFAYSLKRKNKDNGFNIGDDLLAGCFDPKTALSVENLRYDLEDQGRDALKVIIGIAVQLGIEQGKRRFKDSEGYKLDKLLAQLW